MTTSLGSINLLEPLPEPRERSSLLDHLFIIKGYNSGTARWERCMEKMWGMCGASMPCPAAPRISTCSPTGKLSEPIFQGFYGGFIYRQD